MKKLFGVLVLGTALFTTTACEEDEPNNDNNECVTDCGDGNNNNNNNTSSSRITLEEIAATEVRTYWPAWDTRQDLSYETLALDFVYTVFEKENGGEYTHNGWQYFDYEFNEEKNAYDVEESRSLMYEVYLPDEEELTGYGEKTVSYRVVNVETEDEITVTHEYVFVELEEDWIIPYVEVLETSSTLDSVTFKYILRDPLGLTDWTSPDFDGLLYKTFTNGYALDSNFDVPEDVMQLDVEYETTITDLSSSTNYALLLRWNHWGYYKSSWSGSGWKYTNSDMSMTESVTTLSA